MRSKMLRLIAYTALACVSSYAMAEAEGDQSGSADAVANVALANQLAAYGKANKDPIALISAARILKGSGIQDTARAKNSEVSDPKKEAKAHVAAAPTAAKPKSNADAVKDFLDQARTFANGTPEIVALADMTGKMLGTRGAFGGPKRTVDTVLSGHRDVYRIAFRGHESAAIALRTDDSSDVSIAVYDGDGDRICSGEVQTGHVALCKWRPRTASTYTISITNNGDEDSDYALVTN